MSQAGARPSNARLAELVDRLSDHAVTVVGDAVLDAFVFGEIARVSREAPVLILDHRETRYVPGGAANTANNLAALGIDVQLVGRVGDDEDGHALAALLTDAGVDTSTLFFDKHYVTPTKTRFLAGSPHTAKQQIVRLDRGQAGTTPGAGLRRRLVAAGKRARRRGDAILLADYGYGAVDPDFVSELGAGGGPLTLDSRFRLLEYQGVDAATPNLEELERATRRRLADDDESAIARAGRTLRRKLGAEAVLVTRGSWGMTVIDGNRGVPPRIPVFGSDESVDVSGAGDTVIAVFTAARAAGGSWQEAAELANVAGGLVVMKRGTATLDRAELCAALVSESGSES